MTGRERFSRWKDRLLGHNGFSMFTKVVRFIHKIACVRLLGHGNVHFVISQSNEEVLLVDVEGLGFAIKPFSC
jgi:hypothetical protein